MSNSKNYRTPTGTPDAYRQQDERQSRAGNKRHLKAKRLRKVGKV